MTRAIIVGWFSFSDGHATAGDLLSAELVSDWMQRAGIACDIATAPPFEGDVDYNGADPLDYSHAVFVCGPFDGRQAFAFLKRFRHCRLLAFNITLPQGLRVWNPFDHVVLRDSPDGANPDLVFAAPAEPVPVAGLVLVEDYPGAQAVGAGRALRQTAERMGVAVVEIDTRLDRNATGLRTPHEVESVIARMDLVLTTRLHGMVMALKHGVPAVAIDPEPGGAKIIRQATTIGWPHAYALDTATPAVLDAAVADCLGPNARAKAQSVARAAVERVLALSATTADMLEPDGTVERAFGDRLGRADTHEHEPPDSTVIGRLPRATRGLARRTIRALRSLGRKAKSVLRSRERQHQPRVRITGRSSEDKNTWKSR